MIKAILSGCNGNMGRVISRLVEKYENVQIVAGIDPKTTSKTSYPIYSDISFFTDKADVIIDFSHPDALPGLLKYARENNTPIVVATTGLSEDHISTLEDHSKFAPVFYSSNMSLGVNLLIDLVKKAAKILENKFDIEIVEKHHNQKIDAPSGTAIAIANGINSVLEEKHHYVYERQSKREKRTKNEIGIHSVRGGTIVGDHNVIFAGIDEILEFKHIALSREIFAQGALKAAEYMVDKGPAMYSMSDLIQEFN